MADPEQPAPALHRKSLYGLLALITFAGLALRFAGIGWSLPDARHPMASYHPDEAVNFVALQQVNVLTGKLDIGYYNYGTLFFYLVDVAQTAGHIYGGIPTTPPAPAGMPRPEMELQHLAETRGIFLTGRIVSALMGVLTIPVLFALGRRLYGDAAGLVSALLYALAPLAVVHAHFFTVDVGATLFVTLALLWSARLLERRRWQEYLLAGVFTGLAAATKYSCVIVLAAPITAYLLSFKSIISPRQKLMGPAVLIAGALGAFLIACPGPIIAWNEFWYGVPTWPNSGVLYELIEHPRQGHGLLFVDTGNGWWYHLVISLRYGLGLPMLGLALVGIARAVAKRSRPDVLMLAYALVFYGVTGFSGVRFARYMIPLFPALCVLAAAAICRPWGKGPFAKAAAPAAGLCILLTAGYTVSLTHVMAVKDPRDAAADYLFTNAPPMATIAFAKTPWYFSPPLSPWFGEKSAIDRARCVQSDRFTFILPQQDAEFDKEILQPPPDFIVISNIELTNELRLNQPAPREFLAAIPNLYAKREFSPPPLFDMAMSGTLVPDDLLYILPRITVYEKRR